MKYLKEMIADMFTTDLDSTILLLIIPFAGLTFVIVCSILGK